MLQKRLQATKARMATLGETFERIARSEKEQASSGGDAKSAAAEDDDMAFHPPTDTIEDDGLLAAVSKTIDKAKAEEKAMNMFAGCNLFLSREVPINSLEFVILSFGGRVCWDSTVRGGSPCNEQDASITHQVVDRPALRSRISGRVYVQPQWVYDCVNARRLLPAQRYIPGQPLPPHLSPFIEDDGTGYVPPDLVGGDVDLAALEEIVAKPASSGSKSAQVAAAGLKKETVAAKTPVGDDSDAEDEEDEEVDDDEDEDEGEDEGEDEDDEDEDDEDEDDEDEDDEEDDHKKPTAQRKPTPVAHATGKKVCVYLYLCVSVSLYLWSHNICAALRSR
jgi:pescadillo